MLRPWTAVLCLLLPLAARAHSDGMTLHSGKQGVNCGDCHTCTTPAACPQPMTSFSGPTFLQPGQTATYAFRVSGGPGALSDGGAGFNVAAGAGVLSATSAETYVENSELTHSFPRRMDGGVAVFEFDFTAPNATGDVQLYGAGNSVNLNGSRTGDRWNTATFLIHVTVADAGQPPADGGHVTPDAGQVDAGTEPPTDPTDAGTQFPRPPLADGGDDPANTLEGNCGCRSAGGEALMLLSSLALWTVLRRRAR